MNKYIEVMVIVEGKTEQTFIKNIVAGYLGHKGIGIRATQVSKPGQKGGDVRFQRVVKDLEIHLKQRSDTFVTTFVDYYGVKEWPGIDDIPPQATPDVIAKKIYDATKKEVVALFSEQQAERRFIPFMAIHEFEALLFSDADMLSTKLGISVSKVESVLSECGSPEAINNNPKTAPSKRLDAWSNNGKFRKTTTGIDIAMEIGVEKMREQCPLFNSWLQNFETIQRVSQ